MKTKPKDKCQSCGKPFTAHKGIIGTCADLQAAMLALQADHSDLDYLHRIARAALENSAKHIDEMKQRTK